MSLIPVPNHQSDLVFQEDHQLLFINLLVCPKGFPWSCWQRNPNFEETRKVVKLKIRASAKMAPPLRGLLSVLGAFLIQVIVHIHKNYPNLMWLNLPSADNRNISRHFWQPPPLLLILHAQGGSHQIPDV